MPEFSRPRSDAWRGSRSALHLHLHAAAGAFRCGARGAARRQTRDAGEAARGHHAADRVARRRSRAPRPHAVPDLAFAFRRGSRRRARIPAHAPARRAAGSSGRKTCTTGIPASAGSGSRVASAYSIRASTRCRCSRKSCPKDVCVESALLEFPENQQSPIAANLRMRTEDGVEIGAEFDFRQKGEQSWDIELKTTSGQLKLSGGGADALHRRQSRDRRCEHGRRISAALSAFRLAVRSRQVGSRLASVSSWSPMRSSSASAASSRRTKSEIPRPCDGARARALSNMRA